MNIDEYQVSAIGKIGPQTSFRIQCQQHIDKEIENKDYTWMQLQRVLQNIPGKAIATLLGHVQETGDVIVKVQFAPAAKSEWEFAEQLKDLSGFIQYICYFTCGGDAKYIEDYSPLPPKKQLCTRRGSQLGIIMMPFYARGSFLHFLQTSNTVQKNIIVKIILCKIAYYIFRAYHTKGFTHGDLFAKNIVLSSESDPVIIDFEKSEFTYNKQRFWRDLDDLFGDVGRYVLKSGLDEIARKHIYLNLAYNKEPSIEVIRSICIDLKSVS